MLKLDNYPKSVFEEMNVTPEQARDKAIEILESVRFNREALAAYMKPIEEIDVVRMDLIADVISREDEVRDFASQYNNDLSHIGHAGALEWYLNP